MSTNPLTRGKKQKVQTLLQQNRIEEARVLLEQVCEADPRDAETWYLLGAVHHSMERLDEAANCLVRVIALQPDNADAYYSLGGIFQQQERFQDALNNYQQTLSINPDHLEAHCNRGSVFEAIGKFEEAARSYEQALRLAPNQPELHYNLGTAQHKLGNHDKAIEHYRRAIALHPVYAEAHNNLGMALTALGRHDEAVNSLRQAITLKADYFDAYYNLGVTLWHKGNADEAIACYQHALQIKPVFTDALNNLAAAFASQLHFDKAIEYYRRLLDINPDGADVLKNLALVYVKSARLDDATAIYQRLVALMPDDTGALNELGAVLIRLGRLSEASSCFRQALQLNPESAEAYYSMASPFATQGKLDEALLCYRQALALKPDYAVAYQALLSTLLYRPSTSPELIFEEHRRFETLLAASAYDKHQPHTNNPDPERKLRIGYMSSDFRVHPVGYSVIPLLEAVDHCRFDVILYAEVTYADKITAHLHDLADGWRSTVGLSDKTIAEMIRQDEIDILVCLAGHFDRNRLLVCAHKPAPVQVSYHDAATSGLSTMDYFITDIILNPRDSTERFSERLVHLPTFHLHPQLTFAPDVGPLPALSAGRMTFGSFNNPMKITPQVIALWSRVLKAVPESRLLLKFKNVYADKELRRHMLDGFAEHGIGAERLLLEAQADSRAGHLKWYESIDIALDPFPFNGSTTTFEALWMGTPTITLLGQTMVSRWGGSMLTRVGLPELIASTEDEYVECAIRLASDLSGLATLRSELRGRVANSTLCNAKLRTRQIERAYRYMWRKWCNTQAHA